MFAPTNHLLHSTSRVDSGRKRRVNDERSVRFRRLLIEHLEDRTPLATFTVTSLADVVNPSDGMVTIREAIVAANVTPGLDVVTFRLLGTGVHTIRPTTPLPSITDPTIIDGTTQPGYTGTPLIEIAGSNAGENADGLSVTSGSSTIRGLIINRFSRDGIRLTGSSNNTIEASRIGVDATGTQDAGNIGHGIRLSNSSNNRIGGTTVGTGNVISGNGIDGIRVSGGSGNSILGNLIGANASGTAAIPNSNDGVHIDNGSTHNTVGGTTPSSRNIISGNAREGIELRGGSTSFNTILGNFIGTTADGESALGNRDGIEVEGATQNTIGGVVSGAANVISGNTDGIELFSASANVIAGNLIGTNLAGTSAIANLNDGIHVATGSTGNTIGGTEAAARNVISGNASDGVELNGATTTGNHVRGNYIGLSVDGTTALPNRDGIEIDGGVGNTIGGLTGGATNIISGNNSDGIEAFRQAADNVILGNFIGTSADGISMLGNAHRGIYLGTGAAGFTIGGTVAGAANIIAHNQTEGIYLTANAGTGNRIRGNSIYYNTELGLDLAISGSLPKGVTRNDPGDTDIGANNLQNSPTLDSAMTDGSRIQIVGTLNSHASTEFTIDFYSNTPPLGIGEGETWIGATSVTTDSGGNGAFSTTLLASVPAGHAVTATATDPGGSTSEYSVSRTAGNADGTPLVEILDAGVIETDSGKSNAVFTVQLSQAYTEVVTVDYSTADDSAESGTDFESRSGKLVFPAGATTQGISVPVNGDIDDESLERFFVNLTDSSNASIVDGQADGWITDNDSATDAVPFGAASADTSEFMLGSVLVTVVLLESDGTVDPDLERFTPSQRESVKAKVQEGLQWWEDLLDLQGTAHSLQYVIDFTFADNPVRTSYEPLSRSTADQQLWINSFLEAIGGDTPASHFRDLDAYNDLRRREANTNWAFTLFITNGSNDADGRYADNANAWAFAGGPYTVIQAHRSASTTAHEVGHIFYNLDEYPNGRSYFDRRGYYNTQNLNAFDNHPNPSQRVTSIMAETRETAFATHTSSPTSLEMIGWQDTDADGVFDVLDVPLTLSGFGVLDPGAGRYRFNGASQVQTLPNRNPSGLQNDITLNQVSRAQYRTDGGSWIDVATYGTYTASLDFDFSVPAGTNQISIRTLDDATGVASNHFVETAARYLHVEILESSISEAAGTAASTVTVTRNGDLNSALLVNMSSDDPTEVTVPALVTIPASAASTTFTIDAVDDALLDGTRTVTISAHATGYVSGSDKLEVTDHEQLTLLIAAAEVSEAGGATVASVIRTDKRGVLTVNLVSSDTSEATVPSTVTIAANKATETFSITAQDDLITDGEQRVTVTASATGYVSGISEFVVSDNDAVLVVDERLNGVHNSNRSAIRSLVLQFDRAVTVNGPTSLRIFNHTADSALDISAAKLQNNGTTEVTWDLSSVNFSNGYYTAELRNAEATVTGVGRPLTATHSFSFHVLAGDSTGDRSVDFADFGELSRSFGQTVGPFGRGDLDGNGLVNFADFGILSANFGASVSGLALDFGDAPAGKSFPTMLADNGPRHVVGDLFLGAGIDGEENGHPDPTASGDDNAADDEDGVTFAALMPGANAKVAVTVSSSAVLNAWFDFNADGDWGDSGEQVFVDLALIGGTNDLTISVPPDAAVGVTFARFRATGTGGYSYDGLAPDGEVEDYRVTLVSPKNSANRLTSIGSFNVWAAAFVANPKNTTLTPSISSTSNPAVSVRSRIERATPLLAFKLMQVTTTERRPTNRDGFAGLDKQLVDRLFKEEQICCCLIDSTFGVCSSGRHDEGADT